jgi:hypothetical protein
MDHVLTGKIWNLTTSKFFPLKTTFCYAFVTNKNYISRTPHYTILSVKHLYMRPFVLTSQLYFLHDCPHSSGAHMGGIILDCASIEQEEFSRLPPQLKTEQLSQNFIIINNIKFSISKTDIGDVTLKIILYTLFHNITYKPTKHVSITAN